MKEQFEAQSGGTSLTDFLGKADWHGEHDKEQALDLVSDRRDVATDKLAAMDPKARGELEDKAAVWADRLLQVTRPDGPDDSENADKISRLVPLAHIKRFQVTCSTTPECFGERSADADGPIDLRTQPAQSSDDATSREEKRQDDA